jgi:hypothetical protein
MLALSKCLPAAHLADSTTHSTTCSSNFVVYLAHSLTIFQFHYKQVTLFQMMAQPLLRLPLDQDERMHNVSRQCMGVGSVIGCHEIATANV